MAGATLPGRFERWSRNVEEHTGTRTRAMDLYCGNSWSVVRRISASDDLGPKVRLWIVSAGLGLVTPKTMVPPYSATFAVGEPDSVVRQGNQEDVLRWWRLLVAWRKSKGPGVGSIADIARGHPSEPLIAALSDDYLSALREDLAQARGLLVNAASLVIISAGAKKDGELAENFLPCDSRLEHRFGRSRMALNTRVLEAFLNQHLRDGRTIESVREHYADLLGSLPPAGYPVRERGSDDRVRSFIRARLAKDPGGRHTSLLRLYRWQGLACEQSRFRELFREVAAAVLIRKDRRAL